MTDGGAARRSGRARVAAALLAGVAGLAGVTVLGTGPAGAHTPHDVIVDVAVSPAFARDHTVLVVSDNRVLRSTDGGRRFHETVEGLDPSIPVANFGIAPSDPKVVYLGSRGAGIYRSDDGGLHWRSTNAPAGAAYAADVEVSPTSPDVALARDSIFGSVFRTTDGGATWRPVPSAAGVGALVFVPGAAGRVLAGDRKGRILRSDDAGATFTPGPTLPGAPAVTTLVAGPGGALAAGTGSGRVLRSANGGTTWSAARRPLPGPPVESVAFSRRSARTLWASTWHRGVFGSADGGATWRPRSRGLSGDEQADRIKTPQYRTLAVAPLGAARQRLFLGGYDGLFVSDDGARTWHQVQTQAEYVSGLAVSPAYASDRTVVANTYVKGAFVSRDGGRTWIASDRGLRVPRLGEGNKVLPLRRMHNVVFSPDYRHDHQIFTATWTQFVKSTDGGRSWKGVTVAPPPPDTDLRQFVIGVSPDYAKDRTIYLGTRQGQLYRSTEGGAAGSWTTASEPGVWIRSLGFSPDFATDHTMFAGTEHGVLVSTDAGATWTRTGPDQMTLVAVSPDFAADGTVFAGTRDGLLVSHDRGRTWAVTGLGPRTPPRAIAAVAVSPDFANDHTVLASVDGDGLYRSTDGGATFTPVGRELRRRGLVVADFDRPTSEPIQFSGTYAKDHTVFAFAQEAVVRSTDGGVTWKVLTLPAAATVGGALRHAHHTG